MYLFVQNLNCLFYGQSLPILAFMPTMTKHGMHMHTRYINTPVQNVYF